MVVDYLAGVEDHVLVSVEDESLHALELALPVCKAFKPVTENDIGVDAVFSNDFVGCGGPVEDVVDWKAYHFGLIHQAIEGNYVLVAVLGKELRELAVNIQRSLSIQFPVCSVQPSDRPLTSAVIPSILTSGKPVDIQIDT